MKLKDGDYQIDMELDLDRGYGVESTSSCVVIYVLNGVIDEVIAYGMHFINETGVDWDPGLTDQECLELIQKYFPYAFEAYSEEDRLAMNADEKISLFKGK